MSKIKKTIVKSVSTELSSLSKEIIESNDADTIRKAAKLFQVATAKKELLRILKLSDINDKVEDIISERIEKTNYTLHMSDLIDLSKALQMSIDRSNKMIGLVSTASEETAQTVINVTMGDKLDMKSRERIKDTVLEIIKTLDKNNPDTILVEEDEEKETENILIEDEIENNIEDKNSILDIENE